MPPLRYTFILVLTALATVLAAFGGWRYARASAPVNGPIVLISIDTLRADHLPAYGYRAVRTPAIDGIAADGVVFERAYAHTPQTLPSHVAMLSGRLPFETGVRDEGASAKNVRLLPQMLRERGYATGGIVSSPLLGRQTGIDRGFDFFDAERARREGAESETVAEHWLDSAGISRLFLFLHLDEPEKSVGTYDAAIVRADEIVGRLIRYLKSHQLYDRSTIILLSDHGEGLGDHGEQEHGLFLYDEIIRVPLIIKPAAGVGAGRRVADVVQHADLAPTVLDLVKAPIPDNLSGRSLVRLLDGSEHLGDRFVYAEAMYGRLHFGWSELAAITDGRHAFIRAPREELYDLQRDPHESHNVVRDRSEAREALSAALDRLTAVADDRADPKDTYRILETYRTAVDLAAARKWAPAIRLLQGVIKEDDGIADVWRRIAEYAMRIERFDQAADAYAHVAAIDPADAGASLGAASALLRLRKFEDAREHAEAALDAAGNGEARARAAAHELLAKIAIARHDADAARNEADLARQADPSQPAPAWVEGRLFYDQGNFGDALPLFEQAIAELKRGQGEPMPDLELYTAETLVRLGRSEEAAPHYAAELRDFPENVRASADLATLYHASGETDEAERALSAMIETTPTPETYALAAKLWQTFGNQRRAAVVRAEARRAFPPTR